MNLPIKVTKIHSAGGACPYQIEAETSEGKYFYLRYRGGRLRAGVADTEEQFWKDWDYNVVDEQIGGQFDGFPDPELFEPVLKGKIEFPEGFSITDGFEL